MKTIIIECPEAPNMLIHNMEAAARDDGIEIMIHPVLKEDLNSWCDKADVILLSPQERFEKHHIQETIRRSIPIQMIDMIDYGTMNGRAVLDKVKKILRL